MFRRHKLQILNQKDDPVKIINDRILNTEKHLMGICTAFAENTRQIAKERNTIDHLARVMKGYADDDGVNESFNEGLKNIAKVLTTKADHMDLNIRRLEAKIVHELALLDSQCKISRDEIRSAGVARDKEVLKQRQVMELKSKFPANSSATDTDLLKAKQEVIRANKQIEELIIHFERRKIATIKQIITDYIMITMKFHTKALETLSQGYFDVTDIDEDSDIIDFQKLFKTEEEPTSTSTEKKKMRLRGLLKSKSMESLERQEMLSPLKQLGKFSKSTKSLSTTKSDDDAKQQRKHKGISDEDDEDESWESNEEDDIEEEVSEDNTRSDEEESEDEDRSVSSTEDALSTPKNESPGRFAKAKMFGIRKAKPRSEVKHPFKAVAATHVFASKRLISESPKLNRSSYSSRIDKGSAGIKRTSKDGLGKSSSKAHNNKENLSSDSRSPKDSGGSITSINSQDDRKQQRRQSVKQQQPPQPQVLSTTVRMVEPHFQKNNKNFRDTSSTTPTTPFSINSIKKHSK